MPPYVNPNREFNERVISAQSLAPTPVVDYKPPQETPVFPVATLTPDLQMTQPEQQAQQQVTGLADLTKQLIGESAYRTEVENQQGIPQLNQNITDLNSHLTALKNEALAIPLQLQQESIGRGRTAGGLQPIQTAALRNNAIQALSVNSLLEAARGNLATAQTFVDRAVKQRFDPIREEITAAKENLDLIIKSPAYTVAEKNRAKQQQELQDARERQLDQQEEFQKTALAMAAAAVKNNPNNPAASVAANQLLALDPADPTYLQRAFELVGQYQTNPIEVQAALLELDQKRASIQLTKAQIAKTNQEAEKSRSEMAGGNTSSAFIGQPGYGKLTAKQKAQADSLNNLVRSISEFRTSLQSSTGPSGVNLTGADAALLQTKINSIIFAAAQAEGTGALQQADREVIEKIIPNPTNLKGAINALRTGGLEGQLMKLDDQIQKYTDNLATYGLSPVMPNSLDTPEPQDRAKGVKWIRPDGIYVSDGTQWVKQ